MWGEDVTLRVRIDPFPYTMSLVLSDPKSDGLKRTVPVPWFDANRELFEI